MASSSMAEDLVCSVCLALFQEPHMLGCGHNFCLSCLESCVRKGRKTGACPECRRPFSRQEFTCNRALANLAKKARRLQLDREPLPATALVGFCEEHDEPRKLFCTQDLAPICVICRDLPQHRGHDFLPTKNAVEYAKGKLKPYETQLGNSLREVTKDHSDQQKKIGELEACTEEILSHVSREFEVLHQILNQKEQGFKKTVQKTKAKNLQKMEAALQSLKEKVSSHTEISAEIKIAFETADHFAFLKDFKPLMDRIKEFWPWTVKDDDASGSEEEEEVKSNEKQREDGDDSGDEEDSGDGEVSEEDASEEEEGASGSEEEEEVKSNDEQCEDGDDSGDGEVSQEEEDDNSSENRVIPVCSTLKTFKDTLDFEAWKRMLERIQPTKLPLCNPWLK